MNNKELLMISTFDGKILYEEIIKATNAFDAILGKEEMEAFTKQSFHQVML